MEFVCFHRVDGFQMCLRWAEGRRWCLFRKYCGRRAWSSGGSFLTFRQAAGGKYLSAHDELNSNLLPKVVL